MNPSNPFPRLLHAFFYERLVQQCNVSAHTVRSYRDAWRLFLRFVVARRKRAIADLTLTDLTAVEVAAFLQHSEVERGVSIGTLNCRLAALRSFQSMATVHAVCASGAESTLNSLFIRGSLAHILARFAMRARIVDSATVR